MPYILNCGTSSENKRYIGEGDDGQYTVVGTWAEARKWDDEMDAQKFHDKLPENMRLATFVWELPDLEWWFYENGTFKVGKTEARTEANRQAMALDKAYTLRRQRRLADEKASV